MRKMRLFKSNYHILFLIVASFTLIEKIASLTSGDHENNVAILLSSSTFFHNYRHTTNTLMVYDILKQHGGFTDDNIILFLADEIACHACNPDKRHVSSFGSGPDGWRNLYNDVEIDYSGSDVTVDNFLRVLLGRHHPYTAPNQRLDNLNENTNVFIYLTGHGGDQFFKFRDLEHFSTTDLRRVMEEMQIMKKFKSVLFVADTCQAFTLAPNTLDMHFESSMGTELRNVYSLGSSLKDQNSYAHHSDRTVGHSVIDRYTHHLAERMADNWDAMHDISVKSALFDSMYKYSERVARFLQVKKLLGSDVGWTDLGCDIPMDEIPLSDFFVMKNGAKDKNAKSGNLLLDRVAFGQGPTTREDESQGASNRDDGTILGKQHWNKTPSAHVQDPIVTSLQGGTLPSDCFFLVSVAMIFVVAQLSSQLW